MTRSTQIPSTDVSTSNNIGNFYDGRSVVQHPAANTRNDTGGGLTSNGGSHASGPGDSYASDGSTSGNHGNSNCSHGNDAGVNINASSYTNPHINPTVHPAKYNARNVDDERNFIINIRVRVVETWRLARVMKLALFICLLGQKGNRRAAAGGHAESGGNGSSN
jgi:hypothetical protein